MYYLIFFITAFICFAFHPTTHILSHFKRIKENRSTYTAIGFCMFLGWISYFYISISGMQLSSFSAFQGIGLVLLIIGFYLFSASHKKIHKRLHGKGGLTTDGLYKHIRHPMYVGEILLFLGAPLLGGNFLTLSLSVIFIVQILIWAYLEEKALVKEFPEYSNYKKKTLF